MALCQCWSLRLKWRKMCQLSWVTSPDKSPGAEAFHSSLGPSLTTCNMLYLSLFGRTRHSGDRGGSRNGVYSFKDFTLIYSSLIPHLVTFVETLFSIFKFGGLFPFVLLRKMQISDYLTVLMNKNNNISVCLSKSRIINASPFILPRFAWRLLFAWL